MDDLEARTQKELADIIAVLTELTGLPSRWSGRVELVQEALHSISVGYNSNDFRQYRRWEEGVVEQLQRMFRPTILGSLGNALANDVFYAEEEAHAFNGYIAALESLRLMLREDASADAKQEFYMDLLALPIAGRPDSLLRVSFSLEQPQRGIFISAFSRANSVLKLRVNR